MEHQIIQLIKDKLSILTKSQRMVANHILNNPMKVAFSTIDQIAHEVGVSTATIIRLCESLNYPKYSEFQKVLQDTLTNRADPSTKLELSKLAHSMKDDVLLDIIRQQTGNITATCESLSSTNIIKAEKLLSRANRIFVCGSRTCFGVAHYLYFDLCRIYGNCYLLDDTGGTLPEKISEIHKGDTVVVITLPRYIKSVVSIAEVVKSYGASVIAVSDSYMSPLADLADVLFTAKCKSTGFHNALTSVVLIADIIISFCTICNMEKTRKNLEKALEISKRIGIQHILPPMK